MNRTLIYLEIEVREPDPRSVVDPARRNDTAFASGLTYWLTHEWLLNELRARANSSGLDVRIKVANILPLLDLDELELRERCMAVAAQGRGVTP